MGEEYIYVAVDETGNLGKSLKGERYYTLVACVVNDRKRFEDATRRLGFQEEVKFYIHPQLREKVLEYASPAVSEIFYVRYHKGKEALGRFEQSDLHLRMIRSLADTIVLRYGLVSDLVVEVDHKDGISDRNVQKAFENNEYRRHFVLCEVMDSIDSYGLQTNDFFVGAIGHMLNHADMRYVRMFNSKPVESYIRSFNIRQGEPASATRNTGHTDNPYKTDSPPGIAIQLHTNRVGYPMVRLGTQSDDDYLKYRTKRMARSVRRNQGEPASTIRQNTGHTDNPYKTDSPPGIATEVRKLDAGCPVVCLGGQSDSHYLILGGTGIKSRAWKRNKFRGR